MVDLPDDPWSKNPFPEGTTAHQSWTKAQQSWTDMMRWIREHLALLQANKLENLPQEEASSKEFLDHLLETLAGTFDIWAGALSRSAVPTDEAADAFEHLVGEIEKGMVAQAGTFSINFIPKQLLLREIRNRLNARKQYWIGQRLRAVREHKEAVPAQAAANSRGGSEPNAAGWEAIEISFLSDERVQIHDGAKTETYNYAELGFADRRNGKANRAWLVLRALAEARGIIPDAAKAESAWPKVEKRMQEIREVLRNHFRISADPIPFVPGAGYCARFKIACSPSFRA